MILLRALYQKMELSVKSWSGSSKTALQSTNYWRMLFLTRMLHLSQICAKRIRMSEENQALYKQLQHKHDKDLERLRGYYSVLLVYIQLGVRNFKKVGILNVIFKHFYH